MTVAIELDRLTKNYGKSRGIDSISFQVETGEVFGFLGPNGAGKTTAIRTLMGLISATSGAATILGENALEPTSQLRARIGYLPGALTLYESLTGLEFLRFIARMRGLSLENEIHKYAERLNLDLSRRIRELSKGNRQKVGVVQAFMHQPEVFFLDEPTSGLDPLVQQEFEAMLDEVKARGATVLLSSHVLSEVEHLADRVAIINEGKLVICEHISTLKERALRKIELHFDHPVLADSYRRLTGVEEVEQRGSTLICTLVGKETDLLRLAVTDGVVSVKTHEPTLDEIFLKLVQVGHPL